MNLKFTRIALVSSIFAALLICSSEIKISQAASSEQKVHTPIVEEIGELTDEELLKYEKEMSKPKNESGKFTEGVLWKIEKDKELIGYLFGTIHMNDKRIIKVRENIMDIFDEMNSFAMESFPSDHYWNPYHGGQMIKGDMVLPKGETLEQYIGADLYQRVEKVLLNVGLDKDTIVRLKPWAAMRSFAVKSENTEDLIPPGWMRV